MKNINKHLENPNNIQVYSFVVLVLLTIADAILN